MDNNIIYKLKIFCLCLFVFSLGFEHWDPFGVKNIFTVTKFSGFMYAVFSLNDLKKNFYISKQNRLLVYSGFSLWFCITIRSFLDTGINGGNMYLSLGFFQVIILFWLIFNDVQNNPKIRYLIFLFLIFGMILIAALLSLGIGIQDMRGEKVADIDSARLYFMGMNPNRMGDLAAMAVLLVFSLIFSKTRESKIIYYLLIISIPSLLSIIGFSGSRGSFVVVFLGLSLFFLLRKSTKLQKLMFLFIGTVAALLIMSFMKNFEILQGRLESTYEGGDVGGRLEIWRSVLSVIQDSPFLGTGISSYRMNMLQIYGEEKDPHNLFLYVWVVGGLVSLSLLLTFYIKSFKNALANLKINGDSTNIMVFIAVVFLVSKTGGVIESKMIWTMLASITPIINIKNKSLKS